MYAVRASADLDTKELTWDNIKLERRLELTGEGHRFFDLVGGVMSELFLRALGFKKGIHENYPIPQNDMMLQVVPLFNTQAINYNN